MGVTVRSVTDEAHRIRVYELADPAGADLPGFTAGSHVDVEVPGGLLRQYSLCGDPARRDRYEIAVLDVPDGRGGSRAMHAHVRVGDMLRVSPPRNTFPLHADAGHHLLLAGGIGITPIVAMVEQLASTGAEFSVLYCTRSPEQTAFLPRLRRLAADRLTVHHDGGDPARSLDLARLLAEPGAGTHLYCCGPSPMLAAVAAATVHWPAGRVHVERFTGG
ncbi:MAG: ferredoxin reductase, partial [Pseudonocardia sp.]